MGFGLSADGGGDGFAPGAGLVAGVHPAQEVVGGFSGVRGIEGGEVGGGGVRRLSLIHI